MALRRILLAITLTVLASLTRSENHDGLNFILIGDWGGMPFFPYRTPVESAVAKQMGKSADETGAQFVVALGRLNDFLPALVFMTRVLYFIIYVCYILLYTQIVHGVPKNSGHFVY